jgi:hypothetical protein
MRTGSLLAAALVTLTSLSLTAQQADAGAQQTATADAAASHASPTVNTAAVADAGRSAAAAKSADVPKGAAAQRGDNQRADKMLPVRAQLMGKLDSKSAKTGDSIELRTMDAFKTSDGTEIPKGSKIMGHVTSVVAHGKSNDNAEVAIQLDRAELKGGSSLAIRSQIQWVTPPPDPSTSAAMRSQQNIGGGVMGDATNVMGGAHTGGVGAGTNTGLTVTGGMIQGSTKQAEGLGSAADYGVRAPTQPAAPPAAGAGGHGVVAVGAAQSMPHATGINGLLLAIDPSGKISGTFSAMKQNVHLDGGTRLILGVAAIK